MKLSIIFCFFLCPPPPFVSHQVYVHARKYNNQADIAEYLRPTARRDLRAVRAERSSTSGLGHSAAMYIGKFGFGVCVGGSLAQCSISPIVLKQLRLPNAA